MNYLEIINLIFTILTGIIGVMTCHFAIFAIVGLFAKKTYPKAKVQHKYGIVISARNEASVIGNLIKSIQKNNYPQDKLQIFIVAHNCTDHTAQVARDLGATVYEYNNSDEKTKGYALKYLFEQIRKDYGIGNFDGFLELDADNILSENYLEKMNDAFDATGGENVITSYRNSKNFGSNTMSGLYGIYFATGCRFEMRGRSLLGCSTRVSGTGFLFNSKVVENGWPYVTLTEDWEFSADQIIQGGGRKIEYCDDAVFYDEQPTSFKVMWRQRVRWARGHLLVCVTRFKDLIKSIFSRKKEHKNKGSLYDIFINCMPICLVTLGLGLLQFILTLFCPLFGLNLGNALLSWLKGFGFSMACFYVVNFIMAVTIFIAERKRINGVVWWRKILISLLWPLFVLLSYPMEVQALFSKNLAWKTIPHNDTTDFETLHKQATVELGEVDENSEI